MVQLHEHRGPSVGQPWHESHLPEGARWDQPLASQPLGRGEELRLAAAGGKRKDVHVVTEVEGWGVHPQRSAQPSSRDVDDLPEPGDEKQPGPDRFTHGLDPEAAGRFEQIGPVQDGEGTDVLRPTPAGRSISWSRPLSLSVEMLIVLTSPRIDRGDDAEAVLQGLGGVEVLLPGFTVLEAAERGGSSAWHKWFPAEPGMGRCSPPGPPCRVFGIPWFSLCGAAEWRVIDR
jgi:hypothetical protein